MGNAANGHGILLNVERPLVPDLQPEEEIVVELNINGQVITLEQWPSQSIVVPPPVRGVLRIGVYAQNQEEEGELREIGHILIPHEICEIFHEPCFQVFLGLLDSSALPTEAETPRNSVAREAFESSMIAAKTPGTAKVNLLFAACEEGLETWQTEDMWHFVHRLQDKPMMRLLTHSADIIKENFVSETRATQEVVCSHREFASKEKLYQGFVNTARKEKVEMESQVMEIRAIAAAKVFALSSCLNVEFVFHVWKHALHYSQREVLRHMTRIAHERMRHALKHILEPSDKLKLEFAFRCWVIAEKTMNFSDQGVMDKLTDTLTGELQVSTGNILNKAHIGVIHEWKCIKELMSIEHAMARVEYETKLRKADGRHASVKEAVKLSLNKWVLGNDNGLLHTVIADWHKLTIKARKYHKAMKQAERWLEHVLDGEKRHLLHHCWFAWFKCFNGAKERRLAEEEQKRLQDLMSGKLSQSHEDALDKMTEVERKHDAAKKSVDMVLRKWEAGNRKGEMSGVFTDWHKFTMKHVAYRRQHAAVENSLRKFLEGDKKGASHTVLLYWHKHAAKMSAMRLAEEEQKRIQDQFSAKLGLSHEDALDKMTEVQRKHDAAKKSVDMILRKWEAGNKKGMLSGVFTDWHKYVMKHVAYRRQHAAVEDTLRKFLEGDKKGCLHTVFLYWGKYSAKMRANRLDKASTHTALLKFLEGEKMGNLHSCFQQWEAHLNYAKIHGWYDERKNDRTKEMHVLISDEKRKYDEQLAKELTDKHAAYDYAMQSWATSDAEAAVWQTFRAWHQRAEHTAQSGKERRDKHAAFDYALQSWTTSDGEAAVWQTFRAWHQRAEHTAKSGRARQAVHSALLRSLEGDDRAAVQLCFCNWASDAKHCGIQKKADEELRKASGDWQGFLEEQKTNHGKEITRHLTEAELRKERAHEATTLMMKKWSLGDKVGLLTTVFSDWKREVERSKGLERRHESAKSAVMSWLEGSARAGLELTYRHWHHFAHESSAARAREEQENRHAKHLDKTKSRLIGLASNFQDPNDPAWRHAVFISWQLSTHGTRAELRHKQLEGQLQQQQLQHDIAVAEHQATASNALGALGANHDEASLHLHFSTWKAQVLHTKTKTTLSRDMEEILGKALDLVGQHHETSFVHAVLQQWASLTIQTNIQRMKASHITEQCIATEHHIDISSAHIALQQWSSYTIKMKTIRMKAKFINELCNNTERHTQQTTAHIALQQWSSYMTKMNIIRIKAKYIGEMCIHSEQHTQDIVVHTALKEWSSYTIEMKTLRMKATYFQERLRLKESSTARVHKVLYLMCAYDEARVLKDVGSAWLDYVREMKRTEQMQRVITDVKGKHINAIEIGTYSLCSFYSAMNISLAQEAFSIWKEDFGAIKFNQRVSQTIDEIKSRRIMAAERSFDCLTSFFNPHPSGMLQDVMGTWRQYVKSFRAKERAARDAEDADNLLRKTVEEADTLLRATKKEAVRSAEKADTLLRDTINSAKEEAYRAGEEADSLVRETRKEAARAAEVADNLLRQTMNGSKEEAYRATEDATNLLRETRKEAARSGEEADNLLRKTINGAKEEAARAAEEADNLLRETVGGIRSRRIDAAEKGQKFGLGSLNSIFSAQTTSMCQEILFIWRESTAATKSVNLLRRTKKDIRARNLRSNIMGVLSTMEGQQRLHIHCMLRAWLHYVAEENVAKEKALRLKLHRLSSEKYELLTLAVLQKGGGTFTDFMHQAVFDAWVKLIEARKHGEAVQKYIGKVAYYRSRHRDEVRTLMPMLFLERANLRKCSLFAEWYQYLKTEQTTKQLKACRASARRKTFERLNQTVSKWVVDSDDVTLGLVLRAFCQNVADGRAAMGKSKVAHVHREWRSSALKTSSQYVVALESRSHVKALLGWKLQSTQERRDSLVTQCTQWSQKYNDVENQSKHISGHCDNLRQNLAVQLLSAEQRSEEAMDQSDKLRGCTGELWTEMHKQNLALDSLEHEVLLLEAQNQNNGSSHLAFSRWKQENDIQEGPAILSPRRNSTPARSTDGSFS